MLPLYLLTTEHSRTEEAKREREREKAKPGIRWVEVVACRSFREPSCSARIRRCCQRARFVWRFLFRHPYLAGGLAVLLVVYSPSPFCPPRPSYCRSSPFVDLLFIWRASEREKRERDGRTLGVERARLSRVRPQDETHPSRAHRRPKRCCVLCVPAPGTITRSSTCCRVAGCACITSVLSPTIVMINDALCKRSRPSCPSPAIDALVKASRAAPSPDC